jgi:uncharacterized protein YdcH (DUF465 family)
VIGFGVWHEHAAEEMRKRDIFEANNLNDEIVFIKKRNDKLSRSVMKMEEQRCRLGDELAFKLLRRTTEKIFASWSSMACLGVQLQWKTRKALAIWRKKALAGVLGVWNEHTAEETRKRNITERIVIRMTSRRLSGSMWRWCENLQERVRIDTKTQKALAFWRKKALVFWFGAWHEHAAAWHEHAAEETRNRRIMDAKLRKALAIWREKALSCGFGVWHEHAAEEMRKRKIVDRIYIRMSSRKLSGAMWRWCENLQERVRTDAKIRKARAIWRHKALVGWFGSWHEHAAEEMRKRDIFEANTLNDEIVVVKTRNDKLQRSVMKMEEQRCRLGDELAFKLVHRTTEKIFASWSILVQIL